MRSNGSKSVKHLWGLSATLIPKGKGYDFNQAMMDFGALICTTRKPNCPICPMHGICISYPWDKENVTTQVDRLKAFRGKSCVIIQNSEKVLNGSIRALRDNLEPSVFSLQPKHLSSYRKTSHV